MIIARQEDRLRVVTQNDHAHFAAELLSLWRRDGLPEHPRRRQILLAAREHDNGWREADSAPRADPETGRPLDVLTVPQELRREVWRRGVARADADREPWVALYVAQHAIHLHRDRRSAAWAALRSEWSKRRDELLEAVGADLDLLVRDYRWIELADLLSLALCSVPWGSEADGFDPPRPPRGRDSGWQRGFELHGYRAEIRPPVLVLDPFPLAGATTFRIPCRRIPDRRYRGDADLGTELALARWQELTARIAPPARDAGSDGV